MLQRLLVADVGEHLGAPGQARRSGAGKKQASSGHQRRESNTFQAHGFTARIRPRDRHDPQGFAHTDGDRHHGVAALALLLPQQQGVPQILELKAGAGPIGQLRTHRAQPLAVAGPGQGEIQAHQNRLQEFKGLPISPHQATQLAEHLQLQVALLALQLADAIAQGDHRLGLHKHRVAGGRTVVHQARQLAGGPRPHRQDGAAVALRNHAVLQQGAVATHQVLKPIAPLPPSLHELATQAFEGGASPIGDASALFKAKQQALLQVRKRAQRAQQGRTHRPQLGLIDGAPEAPRRRQRGGHIEQGLTASAAPLGAVGHHPSDIGNPLKAQARPAGRRRQPIKAQQFGGFSQ